MEAAEGIEFKKPATTSKIERMPVFVETFAFLPIAL
jgi:hypothetical protein